LNIDEAQFGHDIQAITETIREEGGISIAPHPYARNGYRNYESLGFDAVEGLNGTRTGEEVTSRGLARVGGTDAHAKYMLGSTWTEVYGSNGSVESILENIRKGNCVPRGSWIPLRMIAKFYLALVGRYVLHEPCELLQNGSNRLRKYC
jgi:predicted metal-dependent phosphoesterase TrpH